MSRSNAQLRALVEERQGAASIVKELEAQIESCTKAIKEELAERGTRRVVVGDWAPGVILQERKTIDPKKLLSAGVTPEQIEAGTTVTEVVMLRVDKRKATDVPLPDDE